MLTQYHLVTPGTIDIMRLSVPIVAGSVFYGVYALVNHTNYILSEYIVKMSYSKDKVYFYYKFRNYCLLKELTCMDFYKKKFIKWRIFKFCLLRIDLG
jgi:hypothetical protein